MKSAQNASEKESCLALIFIYVLATQAHDRVGFQMSFAKDIATNMMKTLETQKIFEKIFKAVKPNPKKMP